MSSEAVIDLRVWRQFLALAETLHFGRAAQRLHITQPPLTQAIAQLESRLGVRLFERTRRHVALTAAGLALVPQVQELLAQVQRLPGVAQAAAAGDIGRLRLAFVSTAGFELLPTWIRAFRAQTPRVSLELLEATGDVQLEWLQAGRIDAGVMLQAVGYVPAGLMSLSVGVEPMVLALPTGHRLAGAARLHVDAVLAEPLILFPRRILPSIHDALHALYHGAGRRPEVAQEAIQMQTIVNLVAAGLGIAWVPQSVSRFEREGVVYRSLPASFGVPWGETRLVWSPEAGVPALHRLVEVVRGLTQSRAC